MRADPPFEPHRGVVRFVGPGGDSRDRGIRHRRAVRRSSRNWTPNSAKARPSRNCGRATATWVRQGRASVSRMSPSIISGTSDTPLGTSDSPAGNVRHPLARGAGGSTPRSSPDRLAQTALPCAIRSVHPGRPNCRRLGGVPSVRCALPNVHGHRRTSRPCSARCRGYRSTSASRGGAHRPPAATLPHRQHPRQQLPDEGTSGPPAARIGGSPGSRIVTAAPCGAATRFRSISGRSAPCVRPETRGVGNQRENVNAQTSSRKVCSFQLPKVCSFRLPLTPTAEQSGGSSG